MLNPYLVTLRIAIALAPFEYWLDMMGGTPSSPGLISVTVACLAIIDILTNQERRAGLRALWLAFWVAAIIVTHIVRRIPVTIKPDDLYLVASLTAGFVILRSLWRINPNFRPLLAFLGATILPTLFAAPSFDLMKEAVHNLPVIYDPVLYRFDNILGANICYMLAAFIRGAPVLKTYFIVIYLSTLVWSLLSALSQWIYAPNHRAYLPLCFLVLGVTGFSLYYLVPAIGPSPFFATGFPDHLPPAGAVAAAPVRSGLAAFRNAMPSLHTAAALLILIALRDSPRWQRALGLIVTASIVASTIALGEHYVVDLIAACPVVLLVRSACAINLPLTNPARGTGIIAGAVVMVGWIACAHASTFIIQAPSLLGALAVASILTFLLLERRLDRAERRLDYASPAPIIASHPASRHPALYRA